MAIQARGEQPAETVHQGVALLHLPPTRSRPGTTFRASSRRPDETHRDAKATMSNVSVPASTPFTRNDNISLTFLMVLGFKFERQTGLPDDAKPGFLDNPWIGRNLKKPRICAAPDHPSQMRYAVWLRAARSKERASRNCLDQCGGSFRRACGAPGLAAIAGPPGLRARKVNLGSIQPRISCKAAPVIAPPVISQANRWQARMRHGRTSP